MGRFLGIVIAINIFGGGALYAVFVNVVGDIGGSSMGVSGSKMMRDMYESIEEPIEVDFTAGTAGIRSRLEDVMQQVEESRDSRVRREARLEFVADMATEMLVIKEKRYKRARLLFTIAVGLLVGNGALLLVGLTRGDEAAEAEPAELSDES